MIRIFSRNTWNEERARFEPGVLEIEREKISGIRFGRPEGAQSKRKILDLGNLHIGPSAVDVHVHSRDFDEKHKETFETLEAGALKGGVGAAACMANTFPRLDTPEQVKLFLAKTASLRVKFHPFAAVTKNLEGKEPTDWKKLLQMPVAGLSDDGKPVLSVEIFKKALAATKSARKMFSLHEEDTNVSNRSLLHLSETSMRLGIEGSSARSETAMVARDIEIAKAMKAPIHLAHMSSAESVQLIRKARKTGVSISAEVTPHHALLSVDEAEKHPLHRLSTFKVCPVIRAKEDREALWKGLRDGSIDCFASDHAPHSPFEKDLPIDQAAHGMLGLEYYFPLFNEVRLRAGLSWKRFYECLSYRPAGLLGLKSFGLKKGGEASFLVFDPEAKVELDWTSSLSRNTPFQGRTIRGKVVEHWIRGKKTYES